MLEKENGRIRDSIKAKTSHRVTKIIIIDYDA